MFLVKEIIGKLKRYKETKELRNKMRKKADEAIDKSERAKSPITVRVAMGDEFNFFTERLRECAEDGLTREDGVVEYWSLDFGWEVRVVAVEI